MSKIAEKIAKIIAKAESTSFITEAENLMAKAAEMLNEHGLSMADIEQANREDVVAAERNVASAWKSASYRLRLYTALARFYGCRILYFNKGNKIIFDIIGRESARITFKLMVPFIDKQVTSMARKLVNEGEMATMSRATRALGNAMAFRLNELHREQAAKTAAADSGFALAPVSEIEAVQKREYPEIKTARSSNSSAKKAAETISLHRQTTGAGQKRLA